MVRSFALFANGWRLVRGLRGIAIWPCIRISIIGETKAPSIKEPDGQLISYISATSAAGGFWTNGHTSPIHYYRKNFKTGDIVAWLGIPKYGLAWDSIGRFKKTELIIAISHPRHWRELAKLTGFFSSI